MLFFFSLLENKSCLDQSTDTGSPDFEYELLPKPMTEVFQHYRNFISHFNDNNLTFLEKKTINQASNELWNKHRIGRITASRMHSALRAKKLCSKTLIYDVMGYKKVGRMVPSIRYGQDNENNARNKYLELFTDLHKNLAIVPQGLYVDRIYPFLGASTDGMITCDCHEKKFWKLNALITIRKV